MERKRRKKLQESLQTFQIGRCMHLGTSYLRRRDRVEVVGRQTGKKQKKKKNAQAFLSFLRTAACRCYRWNRQDYRCTAGETANCHFSFGGQNRASRFCVAARFYAMCLPHYWHMSCALLRFMRLKKNGSLVWLYKRYLCPPRAL